MSATPGEREADRLRERLADRDSQLAQAQGEIKRLREQLAAVTRDRDRLSQRVVRDRVEFEEAVLRTAERIAGAAGRAEVQRNGVPEGPTPKGGSR